MIKLTTNITEVQQLNEAVKLIENNIEAQYCEVNKCANAEKYAIPIIEVFFKKTEVRDLCPFITDEWLQTDTVETLPEGWAWEFDTKFRVDIPNKLILLNDDLLLLKAYLVQNNVSHKVLDDTTHVYVNWIAPAHQAIFDKYPEIKIHHS